MGEHAKVRVPLALLVSGGVAFAALVATRPDVPMRPDVEMAMPVAAVPVTFGDYRPDLNLYGAVNAGQELELRAKVGGIVERTSPNLRDGGFVEEGELLFEVERFRYEAALAEAKHSLAEAKGRLNELDVALKGDRQRLALTKRKLEISQRDFDRANRLRESRTIAESTVDLRELALLEQQLSRTVEASKIEVSEALLAQQKAVIDRLGQRVAIAERDLEETRVVAPYDGFVHNVTAEVGRTLAQNEKVADLLDATWLEASFVMTKGQVGRIVLDEGSLIGRKVTVRWQLGDTAREFPARIERTGAAIDAETGGVEVFARIEGIGSDTLLRSGAFVEVIVPDRIYRDVVRLPEAAVYQRERVFVINEDARLIARAVKIRGRDGEDVFVAGDVATGERILAMRLPGVGEGLKVLPQGLDDPAEERQTAGAPEPVR